jgi:hypothetical protein
MSILNCLTSYTQDVSGCAETLEFSSPTFTNDTDYVIKFTYSNGWVLKKDVTSGLYDAVIEMNNNGFWNIGTGIVKVEILNGCDVTNFDICGTVYSSITLNFINITEDDTIAIIPCPCPE